MMQFSQKFIYGIFHEFFHVGFENIFTLKLQQFWFAHYIDSCTEGLFFLNKQKKNMNIDSR